MGAASFRSDGQLLRGGGVMLLARVASQVLRLGSLLLLARLLSPEALGLVGIGLLAIAVLGTVTDAGFEAALVQRRGDIREYFDTVFCVNVARASAIALVLAVAAPALAAFFDAPAARAVLLGLIPLVLIEGLANPAAVQIRRDLQFRRMVTLEVAEAVTAFVAAVAFGFWLRSVWAVVIAMVLAQLARTVVSYALVPYLPRLRFHASLARELGSFGIWILLTNVAVLLLLYIDDTVVGRIAGVAALGIYQLAFRIASLPATELNHVVSRILFPAYAQVQGDTAALRERWLGAVRITALFALPVCGVLAVMAHDIVALVLPDAWHGMAPLIRVLALFGAFRALNGACAPLLNAVGVPHLLFRISLVQLAGLAAVIVPVTRTWGALGAAWAVTAANAVALLLVAAMTLRHIGVAWPRLAAALRPGAVTTLLCTGCVLLAARLLPSWWGAPPRVAALLGAAVLTAVVPLLHNLGPLRAAWVRR